jgi:hypothetical protein
MPSYLTLEEVMHMVTTTLQMIHYAFCERELMDLFVAFVKICLHEVQMIANIFHRQSPASKPKDLQQR